MNPSAKKLFAGRLSSTLGDSIYQVAVVWHIFYLTNSTFYTGLATAFTMIPKTLHFLFAPWIEYNNKKHLLRNSQAIQFGLMAVIPIAFFMNFSNVWLLLIVIALVSVIENIEATSEIAIVPSIMDQDEIPKYNSLIFSLQEVIDMSMKGIFGVVILFISVEYLYVFTALTFLTAALFFAKLKYTDYSHDKSEFNAGRYKQDLLDGFKHVLTANILIICLPFLISNFTAGITDAVLPAFAEEKMGLNAYSIFLLAMGGGSTIGASLSYKLSKFPFEMLMMVLPFLSFIFWILAVLLDIGIVSIVLFGVAFIPMGVINVYLLSYMQTSISAEMLGRVTAIIDSVLVSTMPLGALLAGGLSKVVGVNTLMAVASSGMLFISLYFLGVNLKRRRDKKTAINKSTHS